MSAVIQRAESVTEQMPPLAPPPPSIWAWWQAAKKGQFGPFDPLAPQQGLYRYRPRKSGRGEPARIWFDVEAGWIAEVSGREVEDVVNVWRYGHQNPISKELYDATMAGGRWPDEIEEAPPAPAAIGHNSRLPEEEVRDEIESADAAFAAWLKEIGGKITTEEQDARATAFADRFRGFEKRVKEAHQAAKAPILEEARRIDAAWITGESSVKSFAEACKRHVLSAVEPYRIERKRRADEAARIAREQADKLKAEQAAAAKKAAEEGRTYVAPSRVSTSFTPKKATGLRTFEVAVIDDPKVLAAFVTGLDPVPQPLLDALNGIALRMLRAGVTVPGARLEKQERAQ